MLALSETQELGADFLYAHDIALLQGKVGAGKTATALTAMAAMMADGLVKRWLVVGTKKIAVKVWAPEAAIWTPNLKVGVAVGVPQERRNAIEGRPYNDICTINYDNLVWLIEQYPDLTSRFDGIVLDELTKLKDPSGKRYKAIVKLLDVMQFKWGLTGSFTSSGLDMVFGQVRALSPAILGRSRDKFRRQYMWPVDPEHGQWAPRATAYQEVMERVAPYAVILDNAEYEKRLPPLHRVPVPCELEDRDKYETMKAKFVVDMDDGGQVVAFNMAIVKGKLRQLATGFVYETHRYPDPNRPGKFYTTKTPHVLSSHKLDELSRIFDENQRSPTLVVYHYEEELAQLKLRFPFAVELTDDNIDRWNRGEIEMMFLHPKSGGHGLNLQHGGSLMVWMSPPWPEEVELFEQVCGRLHRGGQKHAVYVYLLITEKTIDEECWGGLQENILRAEHGMEVLNTIKESTVRALINDQGNGPRQAQLAEGPR